MISQQLRHFSAGGLYDGLVLLIDDETRSYWDHITGYCVHGPSRGSRLAAWPVDMTTVGEALHRDPELSYSAGSPSWVGRAMTWMPVFSERGFLPPGFRSTMAPLDPRREPMERGLGVVDGETARFYPIPELRRSEASEERPLQDSICGKPLFVFLAGDGMPRARWPDGTRPFQLLARWYGFSLTHPACEVFIRQDAESASG